MSLTVAQPSVYVNGRAYLATSDNVLGDELPIVLSGTVNIDVNGEIQRTFSAQLSLPTELESYVDFIAPYLTVQCIDTQDPTQLVTRDMQMGLFAVVPPERKYGRIGGVATIEGRDLTWLVAADAFDGAHSEPAGRVCVDAVRAILDNMGLRHDIDTSTRTLAHGRTWKPGTSKLTICNDLLRASGRYPLHAGRSGLLRSFPYRRLSYTEPGILISSNYGQVIGDVVITPDHAELANKVTVAVNDPARDAIVVTRANRDRSSPTSTWSLGGGSRELVLARYIEDPDIVTSSAAVETAQRILEESQSVYSTCLVSCLPDPRLDQYEAVRLHIEQDDGEEIATGLWRWDQLSIGFSPEQGAMTVRCYKVMDYEESTS